MTGREIFEKMTDVDFALMAEIFYEQRSLNLDTQEEAIEFLSLYATLLKTQNFDYNEERFLNEYFNSYNTLKKLGYITIDNIKYIVVKNYCSKKN